MNNVTKDMQISDREIKNGSNGMQYFSKVVYENAYRRITVWFDESGMEIKSTVKEL